MQCHLSCSLSSKVFSPKPWNVRGFPEEAHFQAICSQSYKPPSHLSSESEIQTVKQRKTAGAFSFFRAALTSSVLLKGLPDVLVLVGVLDDGQVAVEVPAVPERLLPRGSEVAEVVASVAEADEVGWADVAALGGGAGRGVRLPWRNWEGKGELWFWV